MTASSERTRRMRERRRRGLIAVQIEVGAHHRRALEAMGLIDEGEDRNPQAIAYAVERFLNTAPIAQAFGEALYPDQENENDAAPPDSRPY